MSSPVAPALDAVSYTVGSDWVATVELTRPPNNVLDIGLARRLASVLERLDTDPSVRVIVLCAQGKHFCAGAELSSDPDPEQVAADGAALYGEAARLYSTKKPIVAAVQGAAVGGGLGLALIADFRIVSPSTRLTANFAALGFHHGFGLTVTLPRLVGQQQAMLLLYTGRRITGADAVVIGLADECVPEEELRARTHQLAVEIAASAPLAVQAIRATFRQPLREAITAATAHELTEQLRLRTTADFAEGLRAVRERRTAEFIGS